MPFSREVGHTEYQKVRRSDDPAKTADEMGILDRKKLRALLRLLCLELLVIGVYSYRFLTL